MTDGHRSFIHSILLIHSFLSSSFDRLSFLLLLIMSAQLTDITMDAAPAPSVTPIAQPTSAAANRDSRIHTHSHIKGLGLGPDGSALPISQGFVGQTQAREALGIHLGLLREGRYSGRPLLLVGPPGTGKVSRARSRPKGSAAQISQIPSILPSEARISSHERSENTVRSDSSERSEHQGRAEREDSLPERSENTSLEWSENTSLEWSENQERAEREYSLPERSENQGRVKREHVPRA